MKKTKINKSESNESSFFISVLKGALVALSFSLIAILIFAFVMSFVSVPDSAINPINQAIKISSMVLGVFAGLKKNKEMGLISGLVVGLLYTIISFIAFSVLDGNFEFSKTLINDLLFGSIIGAICGVIVVNFKKKTTA